MEDHPAEGRLRPRVLLPHGLVEALAEVSDAPTDHLKGGMDLTPFIGMIGAVHRSNKWFLHILTREKKVEIDRGKSVESVPCPEAKFPPQVERNSSDVDDTANAERARERRR